MKIKTVAYMIFVLLIAFQCSAAQKQVTLLTLEWEPYVGSQLPGNGFVAAVIRQAFEKAGYDVHIKFYPWDKAIEIAKSGKVDGIFPTYFEKSRAEVFHYSTPLAKSPLGLCRLSQNQTPSPVGGTIGQGHQIEFKTDPRIDQTQALRDLQEYKFGVVKAFFNTPEFDSANFLTKVQALSDEENVLQLLRDEVDLIVTDRYVARNIMIKKFPWRSGEVEFMLPALAMKDLYLSVPKNADNAEEILKAFNAGLKLLIEDGEVERLKNRYGF